MDALSPPPRGPGINFASWHQVTCLSPPTRFAQMHSSAGSVGFLRAMPLPERLAYFQVRAARVLATLGLMPQAFTVGLADFG